ncbi:MAG: hypothetical protein O7E54_13415 [Planctomycetota bacterium]|nr:hypothetical protein [Planctomycetota bacterium]
MTRKRHSGGLDGALAAVAGGAVTGERLLEQARREGRDRSPLVRRLVDKGVPSAGQIARCFVQNGSPSRVDRSLLVVSPKASRFLDPERMRSLRCLPLEFLDDICIVAVEAGHAHKAVATLRTVLRRDIVPVLASPGDLDAALRTLPASMRAHPHLPPRRTDSPLHERFRSLVLEGDELHGLPIEEGA